MEPFVQQISRPEIPLKVPRKRKRVVISCTECHRRKQKCDRAAPCSNCVARNKENLCHYENEPARKAQLLEESAGHLSSEDGGLYRVIKPAASNNTEAQAQVSAFGYTNTNGNNNTTLGIFKKIEGHGADSALMAGPASSSAGVPGLKEKYKSCIRQLPSKQNVESLIFAYFADSNCHYYPLDEGIFREQLKDWYRLPFATLNKGPSQLSGDMQFFPALLFQVLASALQFQPLGYDPSLDSLKYAAGMTFDDVANDYSESGQQILNLLGKRQTTLVTVQAGFLRTQYLKNCGLVPESWHFLSQTIRDAQEIGLHKDYHDQRSRRLDEKPHEVLEMLWIQQLRRRVWLILCLWDVHMGIVLGRPTSVDSRDGRPPFPIDAPVPKNYREEAPMPRIETDPPTPLTKLLWIAEIGAPLWDIYNLEKEDPLQNNIARVENMHKLIDQISLHCPPFFRAENPDTTFDSLEECHWIPQARAYFQSTSAFTIMALHRPYIFTNSASRTAALKAALDVLRAQRAMFNLMTTNHFKMFSLVLSTFDAIVLVAAIYILHPYENPDDVEDATQHLEWGMERFQMMSDRNGMAMSALGVLNAIYVRLKKALKQSDKPAAIVIPSPSISSKSTAVPSPIIYPSQTPNPHPVSKHPSVSSTTNSTTGSTANTANSPYTLPTISNLTGAHQPPAATWDTYQNPISHPSDINFSSIAPLQPTHDLVYNDLGGIGGAKLETKAANPLDIIQMNSQWQFEGDFGNDSFWGFMNNYNL